MYKRDVVMFDLVSLTVGISGLIAGNGLPGHPHPARRFLLRHMVVQPQLAKILSNGHVPHLLKASIGNSGRFRQARICCARRKGRRFCSPPLVFIVSTDSSYNNLSILFFVNYPVRFINTPAPKS